MKVIISGGGTGGHIYPAIAIAKEFVEKHNAEILYVGTKNGMESEIALKEGFAFEWLNAGYFNSKNPIKISVSVIKIISGVLKAFKIIVRFKPDYVIGTGGYASAPVVFASGLIGKKCFVQEQNVFPGKANVFLSKFCKVIFTTFDETRDYFSKKTKVVKSGNPVRKEFEIIKGDSINRDGVLNLLVFGGSGGAQALNDLGYDIIKTFNNDPLIKVTHITGKKRYDVFMKSIIDNEIKLGNNIQILPYCDEMPKLMKNTDLIVARAGATTLSELVASEVPSILIPSPNVKNNHQEYNARLFEKYNFAFVVIEKDLVYFDIEERIRKISKNKQLLESMRRNAEKLKLPKPAAETIVDIIVSQ